MHVALKFYVFKSHLADSSSLILLSDRRLLRRSLLIFADTAASRCGTDKYIVKEFLPRVIFIILAEDQICIAIVKVITPFRLSVQMHEC